jgi:hypothetical protein
MCALKGTLVVGRIRPTGMAYTRVVATAPQPSPLTRGLMLPKAPAMPGLDKVRHLKYVAQAGVMTVDRNDSGVRCPFFAIQTLALIVPSRRVIYGPTYPYFAAVRSTILCWPCEHIAHQKGIPRQTPKPPAAEYAVSGREQRAKPQKDRARSRTAPRETLRKKPDPLC